jgi:hypothetical protein
MFVQPRDGISAEHMAELYEACAEVDPKAKFRRGGLRSTAPLQTQRAVQVPP